MNKFIYMAFGVVVLLYACQHESLLTNEDTLRHAIASTATSASLDEYIMPDGKDLSKIPNQDVKNLLTADKVALGKMLFLNRA